MPVSAHRPLEISYDLVALGGGGVNGHEVVVVQVDTPCADFRQHVHDRHR